MGNAFIVKMSTAEMTKALKSIDTYDGKSRMRVEKTLNNGTKRVASGGRVRVAVRSGKIKRSIKTGFSKAKLEGQVKVTAPHAHLVELGTKPHSLTKGTTNNAKRSSKRGRKLVLVIKGKPVSGHIIHPGAKARPFLKPAFEDESPRIVKDILKAVEKV